MQNLSEINQIIADFMGYKIIPYGINHQIYDGNKFAKTVGEIKKLWGGLDIEFTGGIVGKKNYAFDNNFAYLIPIIQRIEEQGYVVAIAGISYKVYRVLEDKEPIISFVCGDLSKKTKLTCDLIVDFIKWYNNNHKK